MNRRKSSEGFTSLDTNLSKELHKAEGDPELDSYVSNTPRADPDSQSTGHKQKKKNNLFPYIPSQPSKGRNTRNSKKAGNGSSLRSGSS